MCRNSAMNGYDELPDRKGVDAWDHPERSIAAASWRSVSSIVAWNFMVAVYFAIVAGHGLGGWIWRQVPHDGQYFPCIGRPQNWQRGRRDSRKRSTSATMRDARIPAPTTIPNPSQFISRPSPVRRDVRRRRVAERAWTIAGR